MSPNHRRIINALFLFTRTKLYHLHLQQEPLSLPHARIVSAPTDPPALISRLRTYAWGCSSPSGASCSASHRPLRLEVVHTAVSAYRSSCFLASTRPFTRSLDVVKCGELDHDGYRHGRHQLSGLYHCVFSLLCPLAHVSFVPPGTHPNDYL